MTTIRTNVKRAGGWFVGYVTVLEGRRRLWSQSCTIKRVCRADAAADAAWLAADIQGRNVVGAAQ
jgi:hypothetical protein